MGSDLGGRKPLLVQLGSFARQLPLYLAPVALIFALFYLFGSSRAENADSTGSSNSPLRDSATSVVALVMARSGSVRALNSTLASLFGARGSPRVVVASDSSNFDIHRSSWANHKVEMPSLSSLATRFGKECSGLKLRGKRNSESEHYCLALCHAFAQGASSVVVMRDDLFLAPDFFEYFASLAPALQHDSTLAFISAWNENGFAEMMSPTAGQAIRRSDSFSSEAFLLNARQWEQLRRRWPLDSDWIGWIREQRLQSVYPEIPRAVRQPLKASKGSSEGSDEDLQQRLRRLPPHSRPIYRKHYSRMKLYSGVTAQPRWPEPPQPAKPAVDDDHHAAAAAAGKVHGSGSERMGGSLWWKLVASVGVANVGSVDGAGSAGSGGGLAYAALLGARMQAALADADPIDAAELWGMFLPPKATDGDEGHEKEQGAQMGGERSGVAAEKTGKHKDVTTRVLWYDCSGDRSAEADAAASGGQRAGKDAQAAAMAAWSSSFAPLFNIREDPNLGAFWGVQEVRFTPPQSADAASPSKRPMTILLADVNAVFAHTAFKVERPAAAAIVTAKQAEEVVDEQLVYETTHESRGERDGVGERPEWSSTEHLHRKYDTHAHPAS